MSHTILILLRELLSFLDRAKKHQGAIYICSWTKARMLERPGLSEAVAEQGTYAIGD